MKNDKILWTVGAAFVVAGWSWTLYAAGAAKPKKPQTADKLVQETLEREATEGVDDRAEILEPARKRIPPCREAYWLSGFIYDGKQRKWRDVEEVQRLAAEDDRLKEYRDLRAECPETEAGHTKIARWCTKSKLGDQAQTHWLQVLGFAPDHPEARRQLGYRLTEGTWMTAQEVSESRAQAGATQAVLLRWAPLLASAAEKLVSPNRVTSEKARQQLTAIKEPDAVPAIEAVFCTAGEEPALFGIELLKNIPGPEATAALAWHATFSPWNPVGQAAATALQNREKRDYVPLLLDADQIPIDARMRLADSLSGPDRPQIKILYRLDRGSRSQTWTDVKRLNEHPLWRQVPNMKFDPKSPDPVAKHSGNTVGRGGNTTTLSSRQYYTVKNDRLVDRRTENKLTTTWERKTPLAVFVYPSNKPKAPLSPAEAAAAAQVEAQPTTACRALSAATKVSGPRTPSQWWEWWYDYHEVYFPSSKPHPAAPGDAKPDADGETAAQRGDCLGAGTAVCTETGPTAIELVAVGDRIFCCDPESGCLMLKPVLRKVVRPAGRLVKIRTAGEDFETSGGHVFWVAGQGWVKARDLKKGMHVHTLRGTSPVEGVEPGGVQATYSLEVADFHTFFVGKEMLLTHDNTIRPPTQRIVPGLAASTVGEPGRKGQGF